MSQIIDREWKGLLIGQQKHNGYVNATQLAKAYYQATGSRKDVSNWVNNKRTKTSTAYLASVTGITVSELVVTVRGGEPSEQGTWIHPDLAVNFAVWLSVELEFIVFGWVKDWIQNEQASQQQQRLAPSPEERLAMGVDALSKLGIELDNPRLSQGLRDWGLNLLGIAPQQPEIEGERWLGAAERAEELGFGRIGADLSRRVKLGNWLSKYELVRRKEKRYCTGTDRSIWCYQLCDELDKAIAEYFEDEEQMG
jgi:hypothetical protein